MRTVDRPPPCPPPEGRPRPARFLGGAGAASKTPRRPSRSPPPPPFAPQAVPLPSSRRGSARQRGPRPGAGGTPPPGHPPARSRPRGRPQPGTEEGAAEEQPKAPESETSRRRPRRRRHCGEEGEEEREEGRAGWEKRKKVLRLFRCRWEPKARGPSRSAAPRGRTGGPQTAPPPCTASDACSLPSPHTAFPGRPHSGPALRSLIPDSREDSTPDIGRTLPHGPQLLASLLSPRASKDPSPPGSRRRDQSQTCLSFPIQDHPPLVYQISLISVFAVGYREHTHQSRPSSSAPSSLRASTPSLPRPSYLSSGDPPPQPL